MNNATLTKMSDGTLEFQGDEISKSEHKNIIVVMIFSGQTDHD